MGSLPPSDTCTFLDTEDAAANKITSLSFMYSLDIDIKGVGKKPLHIFHDRDFQRIFDLSVSMHLKSIGELTHVLQLTAPRKILSQRAEVSVLASLLTKE